MVAVFCIEHLIGFDRFRECLLIEDILLFSVSLPPGYALSRVFHCIQSENLFGSCLVIATIRIYFVFLIGVICLLKIF